MNNTLLKIEVCDIVINYFNNQRKLKIVDICNVLQKKYPIYYSHILHVNVKNSIKLIFNIHKNKKKNARTFRCSPKHATSFIRNNNILMVDGYGYTKKSN